MVDCDGISVVGCGLWWHGGSGVEFGGSSGLACVVDGGTVGLLGGSGGSAYVVDGGSRWRERERERERERDINIFYFVNILF